MGAAANQEAEASDPRGPANAARSAHLLYRRLVEMFPNSPLVPEAAWRAADILWQIQKSDFSAMPSAKERDPYLRNQMDEENLKKVIKMYPHTRQADLADYELIDNKLCGDWEGLPKCPDKEAEVYEKYANEHPQSPSAPEALYNAAWRRSALMEIYRTEPNQKKADESKNRALDLAQKILSQYGQSDWALRAQRLIFYIQQGVPTYGNMAN